MQITAKVRMAEAIRGTTEGETPMSNYHLEVVGTEGEARQRFTIPGPTGAYREHDVIQISTTKATES